MPLFGMCAISEGPAAAGPSDRNGQSRWLLNGARGRSHYCHAVLAPPFYIPHIAKDATYAPPAGGAELVYNTAALLRLPGTQAAEFKNNSALPKPKGAAAIATEPV
jgi:hypothetical protein